MSPSLPISVIRSTPLARAAVWHVETSASARSGDSRNWARTRGETLETEQPAVRTALPPERGGGPGGRRYGQSDDARGGGRPSWPSSPFFAQHLSQEALPIDAPTLGHAAGAAKYPSLGFDSEIILPGEIAASPAGNQRRVDITV